MTSLPIKPSELHVGDVIDWTPFHGERHLECEVLRLAGPGAAPHARDALVSDNGGHPTSGTWIRDEDSARLAIRIVRPTLATMIGQDADPCCSKDHNPVPAAFTVFWPGQTRGMCTPCAARAARLAAFMGFTLAVAPREKAHRGIVP